MSHAVIDAAGRMRQLDKPATSEQRTVAKDVQDPETLARLIQQLRDEVATLRRAWTPRVLYVEGVVFSGGGATVRIPHGMNGRVFAEVVHFVSGGSGPDFEVDEDETDANTLVLLSYASGTGTVRITEAG